MARVNEKKMANVPPNTHSDDDDPEYVQELARQFNDLEKRVEKLEKRDAPIRRLRDDR
jgi:hypothetical protein